jgi:hypothetical protein
MGERLAIMGPKGDLITSVEGWLDAAPPKGGVAHWQDGRSAKELAKAWFRSGEPALPTELSKLLDSSEAMRGAVATIGIAEHVTRFDALPGGGRHHDLLLQLRREEEKIVVGIEGKAGEPLDSEVIAKYETGLRQRSKGESTNLPERVESLVMSLFGRHLATEPRLGQLRYQLLTAAAGTLVEAKRREAVAAVLVIHELGPRERRDGISPTQLAVSDFIGALGGGSELLGKPGTLYGQLAVAGGGYISSDIPFYVALIDRGESRS